jgi:hypothetical protein
MTPEQLTDFVTGPGWDPEECAWADVYTRKGEWIIVSPHHAEFRTWRIPKAFRASNLAELGAMRYSEAETVAEYCGILDAGLCLDDFEDWTPVGNPNEPYQWYRGSDYVHIEIGDGFSAIRINVAGCTVPCNVIWSPGLEGALRWLSLRVMAERQCADGSVRQIRGREWVRAGVSP